jgi:hypothetical protein
MFFAGAAASQSCCIVALLARYAKKLNLPQETHPCRPAWTFSGLTRSAVHHLARQNSAGVIQHRVPLLNIPADLLLNLSRKQLAVLKADLRQTAPDIGTSPPCLFKAKAEKNK